jgi:hypothetical protein
VQLTIDVTNGSRITGSSYTFGVPAGDLVVGRSSASLDTRHDLGKYGHISVKWTYTAPATTVTNAGNLCFGGSTTSITRVVASASAQLALTFPCEGVVDVALSGTNLDLDSGQGLYASTSSQAPNPNIYYTLVSGSQTSSTGQLSVSGMKTTTTSLLFVDISTTSTASTGLLRSSHFASASLPASGLSTTNAAGKVSGTLTYSGSLGSTHLVVTGGDRNVSMTQSVRCLNPGADKADLNKAVSVQLAQGTVSGSANLRVCSAIKTTFGNGDTGTVMVIGPASSTTPAAGATPPAGVTPPTTGGSLPGAINVGNFPAITAISPAPGTPMSATPTITVTFAAALPAGAQLHIILLPSGGSAGMPAQLPNPVVSGNTATVTVTTALQAGTYKLLVSATDGSGGSSIYQGTYTVS